MATDPIYILAEAGVNHNGDPKAAMRLVDAALEAGADAVKFQAFRSEALVNASARKAEYQVATTGGSESQLEMLKKLELDETAFRTLARHCEEVGIEFVCTPFDAGSLAFLHEEIGVRRIKISSGDLTNGPFLYAIAQTGLPAILSTGMSGLGEVEDALEILARGYLGEDPRCAEPMLATASGAASLRENVTLLHCTTEYPAPVEDVNLRAMATMRSAFGLPVGYSDHTEGDVVAVAAAALGAVLLEKHFTLDRNLPGPDHRASLEPDALAAMIARVRMVEQALGSPTKHLCASERTNVEVARKSLVAARAISNGAVFSEHDLAVKRPGTGASPMRYWDYLGRPAARSYRADEVIDP